MRDVQGNLDLRPGSGTGLIVLTAAVLSGVGLVTAILIGDAPTMFAPIVGTIWAVLITLGTVAFRTSRITLTPHEVVVRGLFTHRRRSRSRVTKAVRATIHLPNGVGGESLFLLDTHGRLLIRVNVGSYNREDVDQLVEMLGVPCSGLTYFASGKEFEKTYPGLVSWAERHPYRLTLAITGAISLAVAMAVAIVLVTTTI
ncbi:hypothetical protein OHR68_42920 [Spirillospora sp. NBC_00431]